MYLTMSDGVKLFVDIDGASLRARGPEMKLFPTVILIHGGPGNNDHSVYKETHDDLVNVGQLLYVDLRGNGRSDGGDESSWTLDQWSRDLSEVCNQLCIESPILFGSSFGTFVAMKFAMTYPEDIGGLVLSSPSARINHERCYSVFERLGGVEAAAVAQDWYENPSKETGKRFGKVCMPLLKSGARDPNIAARVVMRHEVTLNWLRQERRGYDIYEELHKINCPMLVLGGEDDASCPIEDQEDIVNAVGSEVVEFRRYQCGHCPQNDIAQDEALEHIKNFIVKNFSGGI